MMYVTIFCETRNYLTNNFFSAKKLYYKNLLFSSPLDVRYASSPLLLERWLIGFERRTDEN